MVLKSRKNCFVAITTKKLVFSDQINGGDPKVATNDPSISSNP